MDRADSTYDDLRPLAFSVAYRMLGSVSEAEDVVQETLLRMHTTSDRGVIRSPDAFAVTLATRLSIDVLRSARRRRELYVGSWLPEPLVDAGPDPAEHAELADSLSMAVLVLLETLAPRERAAFLLHDVFGFPYREVASVVDRSEAACRQMVGRARQRVEEGTPRFTVDRQVRDRVAAQFLRACEEGDLDGLLAVLAPDVVFTGDGGGNVPPGAAVAQPIHGRDKVSRLLLALARRDVRVRLRAVPVNVHPGALVLDHDDHVVSVLSFDVVEGQVQGIRSVINPDKLRHLGPGADLRRLLGRGD